MFINLKKININVVIGILLVLVILYIVYNRKQEVFTENFENLSSNPPTPTPTIATTSAPTDTVTSAPTISETLSPTDTVTSVPTMSATLSPTQQPIQSIQPSTLPPTIVDTLSPTQTPESTVTGYDSSIFAPLYGNITPSPNNLSNGINLINAQGPNNFFHPNIRIS
jgi:hypothetical protein